MVTEQKLIPPLTAEDLPKKKRIRKGYEVGADRIDAMDIPELLGMLAALTPEAMKRLRRALSIHAQQEIQ